MSPLRRLAFAWKRHSLLGFTQLVGKNIAHYSGQLKHLGKPLTSEFDQAHDTDTETICEVGSLDIASENAIHAVRYQPSPHRLVDEAIRGLDVEYGQFHFLDFGAGKGRVLLIAAEFPFRAVTGIEFSRELQQTAVTNIAKTPAGRIAAAQIECVHDDVTRYELPDSPLVCYFYNPFGRRIMQIVIEHIERSLARHPRDAYIIYVDPECRRIMDDSTRWQTVREQDTYLIYQHQDDRPPASCH